MPKQVLIVDDEETLTWSLAKSLSNDRETYEITTANNGETALSLTREKPFDLVVLDIRLPGINGLDVLLKIKEERPATKVIIMTAYGSSEIKAKAKARGSLFYIEKPFEIDQMRDLILKALREDEVRGFDGSITGLQLPDLIQMNCLSQVTTALYVRKDQREGCIFFEDGQITHAEIGAVEGEEALFSILSWSSGSFRFVGGAKAPRVTISTNWEYLLIEGMRKADEMNLALEKGEIDNSDITLIDESTRIAVKNISSLPECTGVVVITADNEILYQSGKIAGDIDVSYITTFFLNLTENLGRLTSSTPKKVSFIDLNRLVLVYPFKIYVLVLLFDRAVLSQEALSSIERVISRYQI
ncbi:MAG: Sporulation initiation phosphotransferase F [Deltaproteobacteria bacterium ADurb.BinA179]|jgi:DNA-binding response OmpR family regulator|nr:response regulator [Deltaproteobacteria bacterium]MDI9542333.1 response regulator [Pseudomonadota bacterium]NLW66295.1 response regulator [Bacteriovoracaceae bacterium]OPZ30294.1 MAG: Sporulation initiation phosphotransferase F [Deltaproteobacteria bacterium ADurb.BinA179]HRR21421.1 response regulator [Desulfomonilia bacterium]